MNDLAEHPHLTVSQVLAAHAAAQIAAATESDLAHHSEARQETRLPVKSQSTSFTVGWDSVTMCIGFKRPPA
ncbi:MAG: hypothetical protein JWO72_749 [Caulobacteraceae bacterium]|nr:hypothetical protein [Caulobacteraceae bacterium]